MGEKENQKKEEQKQKQKVLKMAEERNWIKEREIEGRKEICKENNGEKRKGEERSFFKITYNNISLELEEGCLQNHDTECVLFTKEIPHETVIDLVRLGNKQTNTLDSLV